MTAPITPALVLDALAVVAMPALLIGSLMWRDRRRWRRNPRG